MLRASIAIGLFCLMVLPVRADFEPPVAIVNARVITSPGTVLEKAVVLIDEGRITAVGTDVAIPPGAQRIDAAGLIVYAGFIDANTHAGITRAEPENDERARIEDKFPDVREGPHSATVAAHRRLMHPHWRAEELFDAKAARPEEFRKTGFTAALVSPKPAIFAGSSAVTQLGDEPLRRSLLRTDFAQHTALTPGERRRPIIPSAAEQPQYPSTMIGAIAAYRQIMLDAKHHADLSAWAARHPESERPPVDRDLDVLAELQKEGGPIVFVANRENEIRRALDAAEEFGLKPIIAGGREAWKVIDRLKPADVPVIVSLKWSEEPQETSGDKQGASESGAKQPEPMPVTALDLIFDEKWEKGPFEPARLFDERVRLWKEEVNNARLLHEAGIRFAFGTFEMKSAGDMMKNLRTAIKHGLPEDVALSALTDGAARILGLSNRLGRIATGQLANLTIVDKPLADEKSRVKWVFVEGRRFDASLDTTGPEQRGGRRNRDGRRREGTGPEPDAEREASSPPPTDSQPASAAATQTTETTTAPDATPLPDFEVETEADRKPALQMGGNLLIRNATLLTITKGTLEETDLMIQDGRISAIGRGLPHPPGMTAIDLRGYFVMPGIIDCHSHICIDGGLNEFSLSVTPEVRIRDAINHEDVSAFRALAGGVTCIHTMHGSANTIGGQNAVLRLKYGKPAADWLFREAPRSVKFALGENVKQSNFGRRGTRFPNSRMGVEAVIRRSFDAAIEYQRESGSASATPQGATANEKPHRRDLRLEALAEVLSGDIWVHSHCYRADEILRLLAVAEDYGFRIAVLQHILEGYRIIPEMRRHGCGASTFSDWWAYKLEAYDAVPHNASRMTQGGVNATVNSDSPELIRHLNLEAAKSLRFGGLSPDDCLRLITINAAVQLGVDRHVGSLEPGKLGDIAVFDGHPLDTFSRCVMTLVDGEALFVHPEMDRHLADAANKQGDTLSSVPGRPAKIFTPARDPLPIANSATGEYWIIGATIHPISGPAIENGSLCIKDGKIHRIDSAQGVSIPAGVTRIDAAGLHAFPGLINAHATLGLTEIGSVAGSVDTADIGDFQPDLLAESAYNPFATAIEVARSEGVTTGLLVPGGGMIPGRASLVRLDGWSMPEALVASNLGLVVRLPSLPHRFPDDMEPDRKQEQIDGHRKSLAMIEDFFRKASAYYQSTQGGSAISRGSADYDPRLAAMAPYLSREKPVLFRADSYKQIAEALRFAERYELRPIILGGRHAWKLASRLADDRVDVILGRTTDLPGDKFEPWDSVYRNPDMLARAGVRFAITVPDASLAKLLGIEAGYAVAYGLSEEHAIRSITLDAARIIGVDDRLGSLEVGKVADVILCTDTPLQASNCVVAEFIAGRPIDLSNKHTRDDAKWRSRPAPSLPPERTDLKGPPAQRVHAHD